MPRPSPQQRPQGSDCSDASVSCLSCQLRSLSRVPPWRVVQLPGEIVTSWSFSLQNKLFGNRLPSLQRQHSAQSSLGQYEKNPTRRLGRAVRQRTRNLELPRLSE